METEVEKRRSRLADARIALNGAQGRLAENRRNMATMERGLQEAQDRLDAINDRAPKRVVGGQP
jgi:hypothetical protein